MLSIGAAQLGSSLCLAAPVSPSAAAAIHLPSPKPTLLLEAGNLISPMSIPDVEWTWHKSADGTLPLPEEQQLLWLMNRARQLPSGEGIWLTQTGVEEVEQAMNFFQVDRELLKAEFAGTDSFWISLPRPPAAFDIRLRDAAVAHCLDLIDRRAQDHNGQSQRVLDALFFYADLRLSVYSYTQSPIHGHAGWNIDWGSDQSGTIGGMQSQRGHRQATMAVDPVYGALDLPCVGFAYLSDSREDSSFGPYILTGNFGKPRWWPWTTQPYDAGNDPADIDFFLANSADTYVVGTVWNDLNSNGLYDPGEGIGGVTVRPSSGPYFAVTGEAGGYAFPASNGSFTVTFSGSPLAETISKTVIISGGESVLLDHYTGELKAPEVNQTVSVSGFSMDWAPATGPRYLLEGSDNLTDWTFVEAFQNSYEQPVRAEQSWHFSGSEYYRLKVER
jgi:hypothetical protein